MASKSLEKFQEWSTRNATHLDRHLFILNRQSKVFADYIVILQTYPANSIEFRDGILSLHQSIIDLIEETKEANDSFAQDCESFREVLNTLKAEILEVHANQK